MLRFRGDIGGTQGTDHNYDAHFFLVVVAHRARRREILQNLANQTQSAATTQPKTAQVPGPKPKRGEVGWRRSCNLRSCRAVVKETGQRPPVGAPSHPTTTRGSGGMREERCVGTSDPHEPWMCPSIQVHAHGVGIDKNYNNKEKHNNKTLLHNST